MRVQVNIELTAKWIDRIFSHLSFVTTRVMPSGLTIDFKHSVVRRWASSLL